MTMMVTMVMMMMMVMVMVVVVVVVVVVMMMMMNDGVNNGARWLWWHWCAMKTIPATTITSAHFIFSFEDISCLSKSTSIIELSLDGNPFCSESSYKQTVLKNVSCIRQLDMKRITVNILTLMAERWDARGGRGESWWEKMSSFVVHAAYEIERGKALQFFFFLISGGRTTDSYSHGEERRRKKARN